MLKSIDPLLDADLLYALRAMGHGDDLIVADANFPALAIARDTVLGEPLRVPETTARVLEAILSVYPLDTFVDDAVGRMEVVGEPETVPDVQAEAQALIDRVHGSPLKLMGIERFAFYDRARAAFAVVQTAERRPYGCIAMRKGVIGPDGEVI